MKPFSNDQDLIDELRAQRPESSQEFTAELDQRAAAGFPRSPRPHNSLTGLLARLRAVPARRLAFSGAAAAVLAIAVVTVVVASREPANHEPGSNATSGGSLLSLTNKFDGGEGTEEESPVEYGTAAPSSASAGATVQPLSRNSNASGPYAANARHRQVERSAEMVLGADPDEVAGDAAEVFDAVHAANGIVLNSSVSGGAAGKAGARFDLLIPAAKLGDALADFSAIGTVVSRHEATDDITAPTVRIGERLRDSKAKIDGLLVQLAGADSDEERAEVELELRAERRHAAALRSQATKLDRRANLSRVSLRIVTGTAAAPPKDDSGWGAGDALADAGHILGVAAGVTIIGLAILAPLALIALLIWLANRTRLRRARERALT